MLVPGALMLDPRSLVADSASDVHDTVPPPRDGFETVPDAGAMWPEESPTVPTDVSFDDVERCVPSEVRRDGAS